MNYRFNDPKTHEEGKGPYEDIVAAVQKGLLSRDVVVTGPHGSTTPFLETQDPTANVEAPPPPVAHQLAEEMVYHQDSHIMVTAARLVLGTKTFPMRSVTSVTVDESPASYILPGALLLIGVGLGVMSATTSEARFVFFLCSAVMVCMGVYAALTARASYKLTVGNSGCETASTKSYSKAYITQIHTAMSQAIVNCR